MELQLLGICLLTILSTGESVRMVKLILPQVVDPRQEKVIIRCEYELSHGEKLYQVRWYKDGSEFFRYGPTFDPPGKDFNVTGVRVIRHESNDSLVVLKQHNNEIQNIQFNSENEFSLAGSYNCEVTADHPTFDTKFDGGNLTIAILPQRNPALEGFRSHYELGDILDAECTSAPSYPPAHLTFYLNDIQVEKALTRQLSASGHIDGNVVSTTRLGLSLTLEKQYFNASGSLSLTCRSILLGIPGAISRETRHTVSLFANNERLAQEATKLYSNSNNLLFINSLLIITIVLII